MDQLLAFLFYMVTTTAITSILAMSLNMQYGYCGLVNFGQVVFLCVGGYAGGIAVTHGIDPLLSIALAMVLGSVFGIPPDTAFWEANSPLVLARSANLSGMKIYFDCGDGDDFGFEAGAAALDKILTARKIAHEFHIYPGRHDPAYFAAHIPASLSFHSRLF